MSHAMGVHHRQIRRPGSLSLRAGGGRDPALQPGGRDLAGAGDAIGRAVERHVRAVGGPAPVREPRGAHGRGEGAGVPAVLDAAGRVQIAITCITSDPQHACQHIAAALSATGDLQRALILTAIENRS